MAVTLLRPIAASGLLGLLGIVVTAGYPPPQETAADRAAVLKVFDERVVVYVALHRRCEQHLPPPDSSRSARSSLFRQVYLASAIKTARPKAQQGDIFTPPVADFFRDTIATALQEVDAADVLRNETMLDFHPRVYDRYPDWATHEVPPIVLHRLPPLPDHVEYGLLDHDLVLWDVHADLIVDVLPDAIPRASS